MRQALAGKGTKGSVTVAWTLAAATNCTLCARKRGSPFDGSLRAPERRCTQKYQETRKKHGRFTQECRKEIRKNHNMASGTSKRHARNSQVRPPASAAMRTRQKRPLQIPVSATVWLPKYALIEPWFGLVLLLRDGQNLLYDVEKNIAETPTINK